MADSPATPERKLTERPFFSYDSDNNCLFTVRAGVPTLEALQLASCFLDSAQHAAYEAGQDCPPDPGQLVYCTAYLIEMAKAVLDSAVAGMMNEPRE